MVKLNLQSLHGMQQKKDKIDTDEIITARTSQLSEVTV